MTHLAGLAGVSAISFAAIFVRYAGTAPGTTTFFRALYALPFLVIAWLLVKGRDTRPRQVRLMAVAAGTFLAIDLTIWHVSIDAIGAGLATVLANTQIVFVGLFAWLISGEKPSRRNLLVAPVIFTGVVLISGLGDAASYGDDPLLGAITGVIAGFFYGAFIFTLRRSSQGHDAPPAGPVLDATIGTFLAAVVIAPVFTADFDIAISWPAHGWLIALGFLAQGAGWLLINRALPRLPAIEGSLLILTQPMLTVLWAQLLFDEDLSSLQWTGVALVLVGLVGGLVSRADRPREIRAAET
ncbi:MAG: DMT family transporter [Acidimicrobiia bacterium]|nr:DMT family transporter [Acidimicrobiia bacterium]